MREYTEVWKNGVLSRVDMTIPRFLSIPIDPPKESVVNGTSVKLGGNVDYADYLAWKEAGGEPLIVDETATVTTDDLRRQEYINRGCRTDDMIVALWEMIVENRPAAAAALQAIRQHVKQDIPKE